MTKRLIVLMVSALSVLPLWAEPQWNWTSWTAEQTATTAENGNLARQESFNLKFSGNEGAFGSASLGDVAVLVDGKIPTDKEMPGKSYTIGDNAVLTISLPGYCTVRAVRLWVYGSRGRVGLTVKSVEGRGQSGDYSTISSAYDGISVLPLDRDMTQGGGYCFELANADASNFTTNVDTLRINFSAMDHNGTSVNEIEVLGEVVKTKICTVTFLDFAGEVLKVLENVELGASVEDATPEPPEVDGWIFVKWDTDFSKVLNDLTIRPVYVKRGVSTWTVGPYSSLSGDINLFAQAGVVCELDQGDISGDVKGYNDLTSLTNGVIGTHKCCIGNGGSLTYTLPYAQDIGALEVYTAWGDHGRDGATITSLEYQGAKDTEWKRVTIDEVVYGLTDLSADSPRYFFVASCPDPTVPLMSQAVKVRINFGQMDNKGTGIAEVCARRDMKSSFVWESDWYDATADVVLPVGDNLMRKPGAAIRIVKQETSLYDNCDDTSVLTDGVLKADRNLKGAIYPLGNKAVVDCVFDGPKDIRGLKLWTWFFEDSREGIAVDYLEVKLKGEEFFRVVDTVPPFSKGILGTTDRSRFYGLMAGIAAPAGKFMFSQVVALRIHFGDLELSCSTFSEIEVFGSGAAKPFKIIIR